MPRLLRFWRRRLMRRGGKGIEGRMWLADDGGVAALLRRLQ